ncbi:hypothetical protein EVC12_113 [Rhizobium phage RHph_I42]|nr:hypothetical protein EVC12_113 [Rhizobium phage RHph_I42]
MKTPYIKIPDGIFDMGDEMKRHMKQWYDLAHSDPVSFIPPWAGAYHALLLHPSAALVGDGYDALRLKFDWPTLDDTNFEQGEATMSVTFNYGDANADCS